MLLLGAGGIFAAASLLVLLPGALSGRGGRPSLAAAKGRGVSAPARPGSDGAGPVSQWIVPRSAGLTPGCRATTRPTHYVNPLARARVKPERIDQGVDYAGSGTLAAIGAGKITYVATSGAGWPGAFIEYRLLDGAYAGCFVYYAEGVNPAAGLRVGQRVNAGQPIASIISGWATGIELGWGAGISTVTYAAKTHQWSATSDENSKPSAAGKSFSALISSLGGPPGKDEG
jgi:murein DD-endopeptidase MepM/ murein hydrolase activator NlpD